MRSHSRSASVLLVPGITIALAARELGGGRVRSARASRASANSSRFAMRGSATTAMRPSPPATPCSATPSSSGSGTSSHGTTPRVGTPVRSSSHSGPGASSDGSPRKRLSRKPASSVALVAPSRQCHVPSRCANAPPRSMSQHSSTGARTSSATRHVDDVAVAQVDLGRAARALDHDDVVVVEQPVQRLARRPARAARGARARAAAEIAWSTSPSTTTCDRACRPRA